MANLKELRLRIATIKNTRKITAAMSQIASARLRRAQNALMAARPYGERMHEVMQSLVAGIDPAERKAAHPLLEERPVGRVLIIALTADRGLCGGFNSNINRTTARLLEAERKAGRKAVLMAVGRKAQAYFKHYGEDMSGRIHPAPEDKTVVELGKAIASSAMELFTTKDESRRVDRVVLLYNHFVSVLTQEPRELQLLPLSPGEGKGPSREPTFEPDRGSILEHLVPVAVESLIQQAMFNSVAAEIAARRVAMDSATDNASGLIADLTLEYNRERQAAITTELMEIIGGAEALKG
ncbi:ATP synthase F1 subunit gamma [Paraliomyxa miuraensis]|uniref:ATP synthase F1 subunit gamma n=1 Tax=Paraliomyxa miuraensis TaxID=376150 RepID=UPI0022565206|nr:ATP synthase F1 subunit gamma [Paraliomyxa miuraensis]MCX4239566.1 ATP synthase F1 subunit gamma [Paraliomyxa miuraensis]